MNSYVPESWKQSVFADVVKLDYGRSPKEIFNDHGLYPVIGTGGITGFTNSFLHEGQTTVIGRKGTINRPSFIESNFWAIDTTYYVSEYRNTHAKWFFYLVQNIDLKKYNEASGVPSLNRETLYTIPHLLPPMAEQEKIALILTSVDNAIESTQAQINKLNDLKTGLMQELLTKGVGHTEFKVSQVGRIPKTWEMKTLGSLAEFKSGYAFKSAELTDDGHKVVRISNLHKPDFPYWHYNGPVKQSWIVNAGDILFSWAGVANSINVHRYEGETALLNQHIFNFFFKNNETKEWVYQILKSLLPELKRNIEGGAGQLHLTKGFIQAIAIPFPPEKERNTILKLLRNVDLSINKIEEKRAQILKVKKGLMQDLLTGKVRVKVK